MSLEQVIADAATQVGLARDEILGLTDVAAAQIARVGEAYQNRLNTLTVTKYVNQTTGDDAGEGVATSPLKAINAAIDQTPVGGICNVILQGAYHVTQDIEINQKTLSLSADSTLRHSMTFERGSVTEGLTSYRILAGFNLSGMAAITLKNVSVSMPVLDGGWLALAGNHRRASIIRSPYESQAHFHSVDMHLCDVNIPVNPFSALIYNYAPVSLFFTANTMVDQNYLGRLFAEQPDIAGVASASLPWLMTNLASV